MYLYILSCHGVIIGKQTKRDNQQLNCIMRILVTLLIPGNFRAYEYFQFYLEYQY